MNPDFLGKGMAFPLQLNSRNGIKVSAYEQKIKESIQVILGTNHGERLMRPTFGANLQSLVFAPNNTSTLGLVRFHVEDALTRWEPRIDLEEVLVESSPSNPSLLLISVDYRVRTTDSRFNLVYPFYLQRGERP